MTEQAVNPAPEAEPTQVSPDAAVAQEPDIDSLLAEYTPPAEPEKPVAPAPQTDELAEMRALYAQISAERMAEGLNESARMVKKAAGEVAANIPEKLFRGALRDEAAGNPKIEQIFNNRTNDPTAWERVATALGKKIASDFQPVDSASTESWSAVEAAQRSSSTTTPSPAQDVGANELRDMTDAEFQAHKQKLFRRGK